MCLVAAFTQTGVAPARRRRDRIRRTAPRSCTARRERTESPLKPSLLNGTQYVEAARVLGEKLHAAAQGDVGAMIDEGFSASEPQSPMRGSARSCSGFTANSSPIQAKPAEAAALLTNGSTQNLRPASPRPKPPLPPCSRKPCEPRRLHRETLT